MKKLRDIFETELLKLYTGEPGNIFAVYGESDPYYPGNYRDRDVQNAWEVWQLAYNYYNEAKHE